jgi:hypothetical protein
LYQHNDSMYDYQHQQRKRQHRTIAWTTLPILIEPSCHTPLVRRGLAFFPIRYESPEVYQAQPYNSPYASTTEPATPSTPALKFYFFPLRDAAELLATTLGAGVETTVTGGSSPSYQKQATGMRFRFSFGIGMVAWGKLPRWSSWIYSSGLCQPMRDNEERKENLPNPCA